MILLLSITLLVCIIIAIVITFLVLNKSHIKNSTRSSKASNEKLPIIWQKLDIVSKIFIGLVGVLIAIIIQTEHLLMQNSFSEKAHNLEKTQLEFSNRLGRAQLVSSLLDILVSGSKNEKQMALNIVKYTEAEELVEPIVGSIALADADENIRIDAINILEEKGKSNAAQQILDHIIEKGATPNEREAASIAQKKVTERVQNELLKRLNFARIFYEEGLYQSSAEEFQEIVNMLPRDKIDDNEIALAKLNINLKDYKSAAEHFIAATLKIQ